MKIASCLLIIHQVINHVATHFMESNTTKSSNNILSKKKHFTAIYIYVPRTSMHSVIVLDILYNIIFKNCKQHFQDLSCNFLILNE